jgi:uncharacterized damage-inducible protein DinB
MARRSTRFDPAETLLRAWSASARMNVFLIERLPPAVWLASPPEAEARANRTIAATFAHMHNCGLRYLVRTDPHAPVPAELSRRPTAAQAKKALTVKRRVVLEVVGDALRQGRRIVGFPHDAASYLVYYIAHDSHHRGQIALLARLLGHPLDRDTMSGLWQWSKRAAE